MPLLNSGRSGRSIRREVSVAFSEGRPSRLMNPPGILPTEYIFSSKSTLSGKKSWPSRGFSEAVTLTITTVSPRRTMTEPFAWPQYLPNSRESSRPASSVVYTLTIGVSPFNYPACQHTTIGPEPS